MPTRHSRSWYSFKASLGKLVALQTDAARKQEIATVQSSMETYHAALTEMVDVATKRDELMANTLDPRGREIADDSAKLSLDKKAMQDDLGPQVVSEIASTVLFALAISGTALVLGAFAAIFVARLISKPIVKMTSTMNEMAKGNYELEVPAKGRKDEIGSMASAVEGFPHQWARRAQDGHRKGPGTGKGARRTGGTCQSCRKSLVRWLQLPLPAISLAASNGTTSRTTSRASRLPSTPWSKRLTGACRKRAPFLRLWAEADLTQRMTGHLSGCV